MLYPNKLNKKGLELPFNVIIIAIIALLVLVIVIFLLSGQTKNIAQGTACAEKGGRCVTECNPNSQIGPFGATNSDGTPLCTDGFICCSIVPIA